MLQLLVAPVDGAFYLRFSFVLELSTKLFVATKEESKFINRCLLPILSVPFGLLKILVFPREIGDAKQEV